jgi:DNA-binding transcriptional LysR family regulator
LGNPRADLKCFVAISVIGSVNLASIDLNLLVAFEALLVERNVSRAAQRVGLAQPSMSHALTRLRALFGDELFVRTPKEMRPTPRALELAAPIADALEQVRRALEPTSAFDPLTSDRRFRLAGSHYVDFVLGLLLVPVLMRAAPHASFEVLQKDETEVVELLDTGYIDLAVGRFASAPKRLRTAPLYDEHWVCLARPGHPGLGNELTLDRFCELPHLVVGRDTDPVHMVDEVLRNQRRSRCISQVIYNYAAVPYLLEVTDLLAVVGHRIAERFAASSMVVSYELPLAVPSWRISLLWSRRTDSDPATAWLRQLLHEAAAQLK